MCFSNMPSIIMNKSIKLSLVSYNTVINTYFCLMSSIS